MCATSDDHVFHHDLTIIQRHLVMPLTFCWKKFTWSVLQILLALYWHVLFHEEPLTSMKSFHCIKVLFSGKRFLRLFLYTKGKKGSFKFFWGTQNGSLNDITCENLLLETLGILKIHKMCSRIRDFQCGLQHRDCMLFLWLVCCCFATCTTNGTNKIVVCISQSLHSLSIITITPPRHPVITYTNLCEGMWPSASVCVFLFFLAISHMCHLFITT